MKGFLKAGISAAVSLAMLCGGTLPGLDSLAEAAGEEYGVIGEADIPELLLGEDSTGNAEILANYSTGTHNYGTFLDENNVEVYMAMMKLINPSEDDLTVTMPEPITFTASSVNLTSSADQKAFQDAVFSNCRPAMDCVLFDVPDLFWIDEAQIGVKPSSMTYKRSRSTGTYTFTITGLTFVPGYYDGFESFDQVLEYKEKLDTAVADFEVSGDTLYDKLLSIHDQISLFTYYDTSGRFSGSALGGLVEPGVVCEGYSKAFKLICDREGIPCICVFGNYNEEEAMAHMWNYVLMDDGEWYGIDVTWDDYDGQDGKDIIYSYFLKGSDDFFKLHTEATEYSYTNFVYPTISKTNYDPNAVVVTTTAAQAVTTSTTSYTTTAAETYTTTTAAFITTTAEAAASTTAAPVTTTAGATVTTTTVSYLTTTASAVPSTTSSEAATTTAARKTTSTTTAAATTTAAPTTIATVTTTAEIPGTTTTAEPVTTVIMTYQPGDVNHDGSVNVADLVKLSRVLLGAEGSEYPCDVNGDGYTDTFDLAALRKIFCDSIYILH
ncbi:MAG: hypothetical protein IJ874_08610 [Ruminococcus sp.]|nr:hypothetical protein [Ruminococcus sp.]